MKPTSLLIISWTLIFSACTKKVAKDPDLAYSDLALLDSARQANHSYYKNDPALVLHAAGNSPHGSFKLRFNSIAFSVLTDNGKLPLNGKFPSGSFIVKDVQVNGATFVYSYMYKRGGTWLWGEAEASGKFLYTQKNSAVCFNCHNQPLARDLTVSFHYH